MGKNIFSFVRDLVFSLVNLLELLPKKKNTFLLIYLQGILYYTKKKARFKAFINVFLSYKVFIL